MACARPIGKTTSTCSQLWIVNVSTGASFQLTRGKKSIGGFRWSPDGKWIAFTTEREQSAIVPPDKEKKDDDSDKKDDKRRRQVRERQG